MVRAKPTAAKQTNWGEKQVALTWSAGHTLAYETTYIINIYCIIFIIIFNIFFMLF